MTAVLLADVVGYSRLMSTDEEATHVMLAEYFGASIQPKISEHSGRLIRSSGDGLLVEFDSALDAVRCGIEIQQELDKRNAGVAPERRFQMRIGVNAGDIIFDERDIYGNSINIAARLETLAEPGELFVTNTVRDHLLGHPDLAFEDRGRHRLKNIDPPIQVFRVKLAQQQKDSLLRRLRLAARRSIALLAIRRPIVTVLAAILAMAAVVATLPLWRDQNAQSAQASIMVLPFRSMSNDPQEGYFADAVTDDLTTHLSRLADTVVIARATAFTYKGKAVDPRQIGQDCDVRYLLEGSILKVGTRVQANTHLVDARSARAIWADQFDSDVTDLFELQEAVTGRIASSLGLQLVKAESRRRDRSKDSTAIDMRLRAMAILIDSVTPQHNLIARKYLQEALQLSPDSAIAWSQLADVLMRDYLNRWNEAAKNDDLARKDLLNQAESALQQAFSLDPTIALNHMDDGFIRRAKGDHQGALEAFERALSLNPNLALAYAQKANQLVLTGRPQEAPPLVLKAMRLSPRDPARSVFSWVLGRAYFAMGNYDDAIIWLRRSVEERGTAWFSRAHLLAAYELAGKHAEAVAALDDFNKALPGYTLGRIQYIYQQEIPNQNQAFQNTLNELYKGLQQAGMK
ncbi:adenylate/guanylate cyclase domain-containing protein [Bradyrhizobium sp. 157]|uniref:adenylate/guanylate cyclase domain-containing protein n=1 Tax=Bradyrhizobium sp. 157 TaxID=2782631 RepID=UPI002111D852|nr:adenylate/guanylate cyclase domain-containing protein [Bradyrhizobium sp. 157]